MKPPFSLTLTAVVTALTALGVNELLKLRDDQQVLRRMVETTARHQRTQSEIGGSLVRVASNIVDRMDDLSRRVSVLELRPETTYPMPHFPGPMLMGTNYQWFTLPTNTLTPGVITNGWYILPIGPFPLLHTNWVGTSSVTNLVLTNTISIGAGGMVGTNIWLNAGGTNSVSSLRSTNGVDPEVFHKHRWKLGTSSLEMAAMILRLENFDRALEVRYCEICELHQTRTCTPWR